jgi:signal transduction histidine kinase
MQVDVEALLQNVPPATLCVAAPGSSGGRAATEGGALWAVPLWSGRRAVGVLLLGEKVSGDIYRQEEIEIARAGAESLLDARAGAELALSLMQLQRRRMAAADMANIEVAAPGIAEQAATGAESYRVRRALHDDVLPQLHTALLSLAEGEPSPAVAHATLQLTSAHRLISNLLRALPLPAAPELGRLGLLGALRHCCESELRDRFESVQWDVDAAAQVRAAELAPAATEVVFYAAREALRNAARYGRGGSGAAAADNERGPLHLVLRARDDNGLSLVIEDDGVGLQAAVASQGAGQGLALHSTMMAVIGGTLAVQSEPGGGVRVVLAVPRQTAQE